MSHSIFDFENYKKYVLKTLELRNLGKSTLARACQCQPAYVSQVLGGEADFSLEQADRLNTFFQHSREESKFFILLLQQNKAGTKSLRSHFDEEIAEFRKRRLNLKERLNVRATLTEENQARYYNSWLFGAIHVLVTIPGYTTKESIAKKLKVEQKVVNEAVEFLSSCAIIEETETGYRMGKARLHLGSDSPWIARHHVNWRLKAIEDLEYRYSPDQLHYSSIVTLSETDFSRINEILIRSIGQSKEIIRNSPAERLVCFNIDWFDV